MSSQVARWLNVRTTFSTANIISHLQHLSGSSGSSSDSKIQIGGIISLYNILAGREGDMREILEAFKSSKLICVLQGDVGSGGSESNCSANQHYRWYSTEDLVVWEDHGLKCTSASGTISLSTSYASSHRCVH
jgi:hypothetical protein